MAICSPSPRISENKAWQGFRRWCPNSTHGMETLPSHIRSLYGMSCCSLVRFRSPFITISAQCLTPSSLLISSSRGVYEAR